MNLAEVSDASGVPAEVIAHWYSLHHLEPEGRRGRPNRYGLSDVWKVRLASRLLDLVGLRPGAARSPWRVIGAAVAAGQPPSDEHVMVILGLRIAAWVLPEEALRILSSVGVGILVPARAVLVVDPVGAAM